MLAYLLAWVIIPGEGQKSSIAENIAGKKHDARSGRRSPGRLAARLQPATGEWIEYTAVAGAQAMSSSPLSSATVMPPAAGMESARPGAVVVGSP